MVQRNGARRPACASRVDPRRHRASLFCEHSSVRGRQRAYWPRACGKIACPEPGASHAHRIGLYYRALAQAYYTALERNNKDLEITEWPTYFAQTILDAQSNTIKRLDFYLAKAKLYEKLRAQLNERQEKAIARMFREGIDGFKGGLSAENYLSITKTSRATATRDLQDLVEKGALTRTGQLRHTRYHLNISDQLEP